MQLWFFSYSIYFFANHNHAKMFVLAKYGETTKALWKMCTSKYWKLCNDICNFEAIFRSALWIIGIWNLTFIYWNSLQYLLKFIPEKNVVVLKIPQKFHHCHNSHFLYFAISGIFGHYIPVKMAHFYFHQKWAQRSYLSTKPHFRNFT